MKLMLPSRPEAWQRLVTAGAPDWVQAHCLCVESLCDAMCRAAVRAGHTLDVEAVTLGGLLHDIGRSLSQGLDHAFLGADLLRQPPALPEGVVRLVETHTGAGVDPDSAHAAGLPDRDYMPRSLEAKIVAHADNLYSGSKRVSLAHVVAKYERRALPAAGARIADLHDELSGLLDADLDALAPSALAHP